MVYVAFVILAGPVHVMEHDVDGSRQDDKRDVFRNLDGALRNSKRDVFRNVDGSLQDDKRDVFQSHHIDHIPSH